MLDGQLVSADVDWRPGTVSSVGSGFEGGVSGTSGFWTVWIHLSVRDFDGDVWLETVSAQSYFN